MLGLAIAMLAGSLFVRSLPAQAPKPTTMEAPKPEAGDEDPEAPAQVVTSQPATAPKAPTTATSQPRTALDILIDKAGKEPPAWWDSVKLTIPQGMDLTWGARPPGPWNPNKNVSQYYISVINPNPARHQEGCKLMQHILTTNKDNPAVQQRAMAMLGRIYAVYLQDYARGAFWYRKAAKGAALNGVDIADLAFCYWKLGAKDVALAEIAGATQLSTRAIRVLGSMGEVDRAAELAKKIGGTFPDDAYLAAGDAYRYNGRDAEAVVWYQKVLALRPPTSKAPTRMSRYQARATVNIQILKLCEKFDLKQVVDGAYQVESNGYRGPIKVEVAVTAGKIDRVKIVANKDDWPLNALVNVPAQIIEKQSVKGIDMVSGATFTSEAIINATGKALGSAPKK